MTLPVIVPANDVNAIVEAWVVHRPTLGKISNMAIMHPAITVATINHAYVPDCIVPVLWGAYAIFGLITVVSVNQPGKFMVHGSPGVVSTLIFSNSLSIKTSLIG
jgi:hypothetical protein